MALSFELGDFLEQNNKQKETKANGVIGAYTENGFPVIMKFVNELPEKQIIDKLPFLVVVSWQYNGENNNGMPEEKINERMSVLEDVIEKSMESSKIFTHAYSRTGNNLKEFVYYGTNQEDFMDLLNQTLEGHDEYPIKIHFYEDKEWMDFKKILDSFKAK